MCLRDQTLSHVIGDCIWLLQLLLNLDYIRRKVFSLYSRGNEYARIDKPRFIHLLSTYLIKWYYTAVYMPVSMVYNSCWHAHFSKVLHFNNHHTYPLWEVIPAKMWKRKAWLVITSNNHHTIMMPLASNLGILQIGLDSRLWYPQRKKKKTKKTYP